MRRPTETDMEKSVAASDGVCWLKIPREGPRLICTHDVGGWALGSLVHLFFYNQLLRDMEGWRIRSTTLLYPWRRERGNLVGIPLLVWIQKPIEGFLDAKADESKRNFPLLLLTCWKCCWLLPYFWGNSKSIPCIIFFFYAPFYSSIKVQLIILTMSHWVQKKKREKEKWTPHHFDHSERKLQEKKTFKVWRSQESPLLLGHWFIVTAASQLVTLWGMITTPWCNPGIHSAEEWVPPSSTEWSLIPPLCMLMALKVRVSSCVVHKWWWSVQGERSNYNIGGEKNGNMSSAAGQLTAAVRRLSKLSWVERIDRLLCAIWYVCSGLHYVYYICWSSAISVTVRGQHHYHPPRKSPRWRGKKKKNRQCSACFRFHNPFSRQTIETIDDHNSDGSW